MERLTNKREADAQREEYERRLANGYPRNIPEERFLRLAAYEDTRLMPEEVLPKDKADEIALKLMRLADLESLCNYTRLRELAEADKDGRVVVLPCKVGDTYYTIDRFCSEEGYYDEKVVHHVWDCEYCNLSNCDMEYRVTENIFQCEKHIYEKKNEIGKCVWLTREEAEKALEARNGDQ